jgi:hypothetical protein
MMRCFEIMPQASRVFTFSQSEAMKCAPRYVGEILGQKSSKNIDSVKRKKSHASKIPEKRARYNRSLMQVLRKLATDPKLSAL